MCVCVCVCVYVCVCDKIGKNTFFLTFFVLIDTVLV